jgi:hydroxyacylglutathione hydrolase
MAQNLGIYQIPVLTDNFIYIVRDEEQDLTGVVDPAVKSPVIDFLSQKGWGLDFIINTHHHQDHTGGNLPLKRRFGSQVVGPMADDKRIPGIDLRLKDKDSWSFGSHQAIVYDTPGHTKGHCIFYFAKDLVLFCGDTLFSMGCGRLFEGDAEQMLKSLEKIKGMNPDTRIYCAHEYTEANGRFALTVEPNNPDLISRMVEVRELRRQGKATVPSTLRQELATNPFLRTHEQNLRDCMDGFTGTEAELFAVIRQRKDVF